VARAGAFGRRLRAAGLNLPHTDSQILPIVIGPADATVASARRLLNAGVYVAAIRPPTVPANTSRLRVSLMATHSDDDVAEAERAIVAAVAAP
jgi:8-amino-7-oxononanoate synthase